MTQEVTSAGIVVTAKAVDLLNQQFNKNVCRVGGDGTTIVLNVSKDKIFEGKGSVAKFLTVENNHLFLTASSEKNNYKITFIAPE